MLALAGAAVALAGGLLIAWVVMSGHRGERTAAPPASQGGLVIDTSGVESPHMDSAKPLRCFVAGQFVGELTLAACARRNGVATDALDVGLDASGALAAADQAGAELTPLPPPEDSAGAPPQDVVPAPAAPQAAPLPVVGSPSSCWRYAEAQWRKLPADIGLGACVQALFAGRCERPGGATYGRWGQQTVRLVPGRVEISGDNHSFRLLAEQGPGCVIGPIG